MENSSRLLKLYEQYQVICNLSGHLHLQHIAQSPGGLPEIVTSSLAVNPNQYGILELSGNAASYQTMPVDVAAWAREQNNQKPELQNFPSISRQFFWNTGYRQAIREQGGTAEGNDLAAFFANLNTAYFAGRMDTVSWDESLFDLWQTKGSFISQYLTSIVDDGFQNQTKIEFSFPH